MTNKLLPLIFAAAFLLTLAGSISHVAWFFGALEADRNTALGVIIALGLDSVIGAVTLAQVEYRRRSEAIPRSMIVLLVGLVAVSAAANYLHADAYNSLSGADWRRVLTNLLGALPLPFSQLLYVEVACAAHRPATQASVAEASPQASIAASPVAASQRKQVLPVALPSNARLAATLADVEASPATVARENTPQPLPQHIAPPATSNLPSATSIAGNRAVPLAPPPPAALPLAEASSGNIYATLADLARARGVHPGTVSKWRVAGKVAVHRDGYQYVGE